MKESMKKAFELAQKEAQEKEISNLKEIVKKLLQSKRDKETEKDNLDKEIRAIKKVIEDFKEGRLDKVKEFIDTDPVAEKVAPINITVINDNNQPTKPWYWNYEVVWYYPQNNWNSLSNGVVYTSTSNSLYTSNDSCSLTASGNDVATFTSGTYSLDNGQIINL